MQLGPLASFPNTAQRGVLQTRAQPDANTVCLSIPGDVNPDSTRILCRPLPEQAQHGVPKTLDGISEICKNDQTKHVKREEQRLNPQWNEPESWPWKSENPVMVLRRQHSPAFRPAQRPARLGRFDLFGFNIQPPNPSNPPGPVRNSCLDEIHGCPFHVWPSLAFKVSFQFGLRHRTPRHATRKTIGVSRIRNSSQIRAAHTL